LNSVIPSKNEEEEQQQQEEEIQENMSSDMVSVPDP